MCVCLPHFFRKKTLGSRDRGLLWRPANRDSPCLPGPLGAWVLASWIGDSAAQSLNAPQTASWGSFVGLGNSAAAPPQADRVESIGLLGSLTQEHWALFANVGFGSLCSGPFLDLIPDQVANLSIQFLHQIA